jgi:hypothetical protein
MHPAAAHFDPESAVACYFSLGECFAIPFLYFYELPLRENVFLSVIRKLINGLLS